jgi:acyl-CoA hydrolase
MEIGAKVGHLIGDGATLQLGIGSIPDAVLHALSGHKYLRIWSEMFSDGALHSPGGLAVIALPSWHPKADCSTIVPLLTSPVTSFQQSHIVSEQGVASIWGSDQSEQASKLIEEVAHPKERDFLRDAAAQLGLVR